jgi:multicomponent K+:H+ antiporter subunit E
MRRLFPHPYVSLMVLVTWMLLVNQVKLGSLVLASFLAIVIPLFTARYWPDPPRLLSLPRLAAYVAIVIWDILVANIAVARIVLFRRNADIDSRWITVPLELRSPEAITVLAGTITLTPGTVTAEMSSCGRALLVHALHAPDPDAVREDIKTRYEARLLRIFE